MILCIVFQVPALLVVHTYKRMKVCKAETHYIMLNEKTIIKELCNKQNTQEL